MIPKIDSVDFNGNVDLSKKIPFKIAANQFTFQTFRKEIYNDPPDSVVREIIRNAVDANIENGKADSPITIIDGPSLVIIDEGKGISHDTIVNVVCYYGESTKRGTNNQEGMFGLGLKSVFSITDQFSIETVCEKDGRNYKSIYLMSLDDTEGGGIIPLQLDSLTDEQTGTKVKIPISTHLKSKITSSINKYCNFIKPRPKIALSSGVVDFHEPIIETETWAIYSPEVMGKYEFNILYNQTPYKISGNLPTGLVLKFKTGEVEVPASRESIRTTESSKSKIEEILNEYRVFVKEKIEKEVSELETFYSWYKYSRTNSEIINFIKINSFNLKDNKKIENSKELQEFNIIKLNPHYYQKRLSFYYNYKSDSLLNINIDDFAFMQKDYYEKIENNSYLKRKITHHLRSTHKNGVIFLDDNSENWIIKELMANSIKPEDIKLSSTGGGGKRDKDVVRVKTINGSRSINVTKDNYVYLIGENPPYVPVIDKFPAIGCSIQENRRIIKKISNMNNWFNPKDYLEKLLEEYKIDNNDFNKIIQNHFIKLNTNYVKYALNLEYNQDIYNKYSKNEYAISNIVIFAINNKLVKKDDFNYTEIAYQKYPLLYHIDDYYFNNHRNDVEKYIKLINQFGEQV